MQLPLRIKRYRGMVNGAKIVNVLPIRKRRSATVGLGIPAEKIPAAQIIHIRIERRYTIVKMRRAVHFAFDFRSRIDRGIFIVRYIILGRDPKRGEGAIAVALVHGVFVVL